MRNADVIRFVELTRQIKEHEDNVEALKEKRKALEERLIENMTAAGMQRVTVDGTTVYVKREIWAGAANGMPALVAALREEGLEDLVTESAGSQRLSAWVREQDMEKCNSPEIIISRLPARLRELVKVSEKYSLRAVKA